MSKLIMQIDFENQARFGGNKSAEICKTSSEWPAKIELTAALASKLSELLSREPRIEPPTKSILKRQYT